MEADPRRLQRARQAASQLSVDCTMDMVSALVESPDADQRLISLMLIQRLVEDGDSRPEFFSLAECLIPDSDNDCRWQALIAVGEFIQDDPMRVWDVVCKYGMFEDSDMRAGVATTLLEHLFDYDKDIFLPLAEERAKSDANFAEMLDLCWFRD